MKLLFYDGRNPTPNRIFVTRPCPYVGHKKRNITYAHVNIKIILLFESLEFLGRLGL